MDTTNPRSTRYRLGQVGIAFLIAMVLVTSSIGVVAGTPADPLAPSPGTDQSLIVHVTEDGSAFVSVVLSFELTTDAERTAFETLVEDESNQIEVLDRFEDRLSDVVSTLAHQTDREMTVDEPAITLTTSNDGSLGIVSFSFQWTNLAVVDGNSLVLSEPFSSGFEGPSTLIVTPPEGYDVTHTNVSPTDTRPNGALVWDGDRDLSSFEVMFVVSDTDAVSADDTQIESDGQPGFGLLAGALALLVPALLVRARR